MLFIIWAASAVPFSVTDAAVCLVLCSWYTALTLLWGVSAAPQPVHIYPGLLKTCPASYPGHSSEWMPLAWLPYRHPGNPSFSLLAKSQHETFVTCPASKMCSSSVASVLPSLHQIFPFHGLLPDISHQNQGIAFWLSSAQNFQHCVCQQRSACPSVCVQQRLLLPHSGGMQQETLLSYFFQSTKLSGNAFCLSRQRAHKTN